MSAILYYNYFTGVNEDKYDRERDYEYKLEKYLIEDPSIKDNIYMDDLGANFAYTGSQLNDIKKMYKEVFGEEITTYENDIVCPDLYYSKKLDILFGSGGCGGTHGISELTYIYMIIQKMPTITMPLLLMEFKIGIL